MKAIKLVFVAALTAVVLMLTSCMGDGNNKREGYGIGMIIYDSTIQKPLLYGVDVYPLYSSSVLEAYMKSLENNQYAIVSYFSYDLDAPENENASTNGYVNATVQIQSVESELTSGRVIPATLDNTLNTNEVKPGGLDIYTFYEHKFLTGIGINNYTKDDNIYFQMTYDSEQESETSSNSGGLKVYDVYLRMIHDVTGTGSSNSDVVVFDMNSAVRAFKQVESGSSFYIRVNYASTIEDDKVTKWTSYPTLYPVENK